MCMKRTNINLTDADQQAIQVLRERYGLTNDAAAIRLALRVATQGADMHTQSQANGLTVWAAHMDSDGNKVIHARRGVVVGELRRPSGRVSYRVQWDDGDESTSVAQANLSFSPPSEAS